MPASVNLKSARAIVNPPPGSPVPASAPIGKTDPLQKKNACGAARHSRIAQLKNIS